MVEGGDRAGRPAGFWIRAAAFAIDVVIVVAADAALRLLARRLGGAAARAGVVDGAILLASLAFTVAYVTALHAAFGQTVGKALVGIRVIGTDGEPLPWGAALLRFIVWPALLPTLGLSHVMAGLRRDRRALHDLIAGSRVEWVRPVARATPAKPGPSSAVGAPLDQAIPSQELAPTAVPAAAEAASKPPGGTPSAVAAGESPARAGGAAASPFMRRPATPPEREAGGPSVHRPAPAGPAPAPETAGPPESEVTSPFARARPASAVGRPKERERE